MNTEPNLTVFGRHLKTCLEIHNLDIARLADRTAIEKQRLDAMLNGATDISSIELVTIVDVFRIESTLLLSEDPLPYDTYRVACACNYTTAEPSFFRHLQMISRRLQPQPDTPQSEYKKRKDYSDESSAPLAFTSDQYQKIMSTLAAYRLLQDLWEKDIGEGKKFSGYEFKSFLDIPNDIQPEERGIESARQFRNRFGLPHDKPVKHIRQYAREIGVHVFRQTIHPATTESQEKLPFRGVCLAGKIGNNDNAVSSSSIVVV